MELDGDEVPLDYGTAVTLLRILQESIQNAVRHGRAEQVFVSIRFGDQRVALTVEDDGHGFDVIAARRTRVDGQGLGLLGMEERASLLGGTLDITSAPGDGTVVRASVPVPAPPARPAAARLEPSVNG